MCQDHSHSEREADDLMEHNPASTLKTTPKLESINRLVSSISEADNVHRSISRSFPAINAVGNLNKFLARSFPVINAVENLNMSLARSFPAINVVGNLNKFLARSFPAINVVGNLNMSLARPFPAINVVGNLNMSLARPFPAINVVGNLNMSLARSFPAINVVGNLNMSLARSFPVLTTASSIQMDYFRLIPDLIRAAKILTAEPSTLQFENTGWFPHGTFPTEVFDESQSEAEIDRKVLAHYRENWIAVRESIENELSGYLINEREKSVLRQALQAHGSGLYDLVSPTLFSEVERVVRVHLHGNKLGTISVGREVANRIAELPISAFPDRFVGYVGFDLLSRDLYANIRTDDQRERFSNLSIPNRHAVIHGLVDYQPEKNSLNSIFIASYFFQLITAIKIRETKRLLADMQS